MRGKLEFENRLPFESGITPAHAGKTAQAFREAEERAEEARGSPPRMRGKLYMRVVCVGNRGITPAHAGKTAAVEQAANVFADHPRACGEN